MKIARMIMMFGLVAAMGVNLSANGGKGDLSPEKFAQMKEGLRGLDPSGKLAETFGGIEQTFRTTQLAERIVDVDIDDSSGRKAIVEGELQRIEGLAPESRIPALAALLRAIDLVPMREQNEKAGYIAQVKKEIKKYAPRYWDAIDGRSVLVFNTVTLNTPASLSSDGKHLGFIARDPKHGRMLQVTDIQTKKIAFGHPSSIDVVFHPSKPWALVAGGWGISVWDIESLKKLAKFSVPTGEYTPQQPLFSPDGDYVISTSEKEEGKAHVWKTSDGSLQATVTQTTDGQIISMAWNHKGDRFVTIGGDIEQENAEEEEGEEGEQEPGVQAAPAKVWSRSGKLIHSLEQVDPFGSAHFSPDDKLIATCASQAEFPVKVWDAASGKMVTQLAEDEHLTSTPWSADSRHIITRSDFEKAVKVWDARTGKLVQNLRHPSMVLDAIYSPDGKYIASQPEKGRKCGRVLSRVFLWDAKSGKKTILQAMDEIVGMEFSKDSQTLLVTTTKSVEFFKTSGLKMALALPTRSLRRRA